MSEASKSKAQLRTTLPAIAPTPECGIWSVLRHCVGRDVLKVSMPLQFNEPLSFLQRLSEQMEYAELLQKVQDATSPVDRIQYVAAFAVSGLACNWNRLGKPFNSVIGETFELRRDDYRMVSEQVSHHPPIYAYHADSKIFSFDGWVHPKLKLWGKTVEVHSKGVMKLNMKKHKEKYTWKPIECTIHGIISGKLWMEHHGTMEITCAESDLTLSLYFKPVGWINKDLHLVDGFITDSKKTKHGYIYGKWKETLRFCDMDSYDDYVRANVHKSRKPETGSENPEKISEKFHSLSLASLGFEVDSAHGGDVSPGNEDEPDNSDGQLINIPNSVTLWEVNPRPSYAANYYHFTLFALSLNQILPEMGHLCPTDSRMRPDIRLMEEGELQKASEENHQLGNRQRKFLKTHEAGYKPLWFDKAGDDWSFNGKYWKDFNKSHNFRLF